jgi:hypothetical protein
MAKSDSWENGLLLLLFNNDDCSLIGDATGLRGSSADGNLYISLHTSSPGEAGDQTTNETAYTNYARVAVARTTGGWTVSTNTATNAAEVAFPECGASGATITHFGIGASTSGAGKLLYHAALNASRSISTGITPRFAAGEIDIAET